MLQIGGKVTEGRPKTRKSARRLWVDAGSNRRLKEHRRDQVASRLRASNAWQDNDLVFCRADGSPYPPDEVSRI